MNIKLDYIGLTTIIITLQLYYYSFPRRNVLSFSHWWQKNLAHVTIKIEQTVKSTIFRHVIQTIKYTKSLCF